MALQTVKEMIVKKRYHRWTKILLLLLLLGANCYVLISLYFEASTDPLQTHLKNVSTAHSSHLPDQQLIRKLSAMQTTETVKTVEKPQSPFIDPVSMRNRSSQAQKHIILQWNPPPWLNDWSLNIDLSDCSYKNCLLMHNHAVLQQSSLIVFNLPHFGLGDTPPVDREHRNPNQIWAFFTLESPLHIRHETSNSNWQNMFNWSWTYKSSSDIFHPYGILVSKESPPKRNYSEIFHKKKKFAAWAVSNCNAPSRRKDYVKILQKYIDVDIYGGCGNTAPSDLENFLNENYKFYLGFENSLCDDYMTEKFFHYYPLDVITVLRGSINYTKYLPDGSYIDTANFSSIPALAKFMLEVGNNEAEYVKYLKIKDKYVVHEREFMYGEALCVACAKLNNLDKHGNTYKDPPDWLGPCFHDVQDLKDDPFIFSKFDANKTNVTNPT